MAAKGVLLCLVYCVTQRYHCKDIPCIFNQQQQQQHTLLTFPKGAFQRQCYKNNPITIKKSYLQLKMF